MRPVVSLCFAVLVIATAACTTAVPTPSPVPPTSAPTQPATPATPATPSTPPVSSSPLPSSTPEASDLPTSLPSPTSTPTVEPTAPPTPTNAPSPGQTAGAIEHPTAADAVVLRVEQQGGFVMQGFVFARVPGFNLYGDGTIVYRPADTEGSIGDVFPPLLVAHMDEDHVQALLRFVLGAGRLANAKPLYPSMAGAGDIPATVFTLAAGEFSKKVVVQALGGGDDPQMTADDARDRVAFQALRDFLEDFGKQVATGQADPVGPYTPKAYMGEMYPTGSPPDPASKPWPWPEITQQQLIVGPNDNQTFLVDLTPDQVAKLDPLANLGGLVGVQITGPDKKAYSMSIRPLLPDDKPGQLPGGPAPAA